MLFVESTLMGYAIEASDGKIGAVRDFLLTIRAGRSGGCLDAGSWLHGGNSAPSVGAWARTRAASIAVKLTKRKSRKPDSSNTAGVASDGSPSL